MLGLGSLIFAQKTSTQKLENKKAETSVEAKKKALEEEKARLIKPYHPEEDADEAISILLNKAKSENKNIILQAGGNWCIWCLRFNQFVEDTPELKELVDGNYLYYHLNWSTENKNENIFNKYGNPGEKYGYPVFIILNKNNEVVHIQDSAVLENGKGYSIEKVRDFLLKWKEAKK